MTATAWGAGDGIGGSTCNSTAVCFSDNLHRLIPSPRHTAGLANATTTTTTANQRWRVV